MSSKTDNEHIISFIETTLEKIQEIKDKISGLEKNLKENPAVKNVVKEFDLVLNAVKRGLLTLDTLKEEYRENEQIINAAIEVDVTNYQYLNDNFKSSFELTLKVLKSNGLMLEFANGAKKNIELCKIAYENNPESLKFVDKSIVSEVIPEEKVKELLKDDGLYLKNLPEDLRNNKIFAAEAINQNYEAFAFTKCEEIVKDKELVLEVVSKNGLLLEFVHEDLKQDFEVIITSLSNNKESKKFVPEEIRKRILSIFN